jgi:hypothetical protein|tara:strand:- start:92 stop:202 length:111 start_codon:yes stop_codon:yes gene_type:complete
MSDERTVGELVEMGLSGDLERGRFKVFPLFCEYGDE